MDVAVGVPASRGDHDVALLSAESVVVITLTSWSLWGLVGRGVERHDRFADVWVVVHERWGEGFAERAGVFGGVAQVEVPPPALGVSKGTRKPAHARTHRIAGGEVVEAL